MSTIMTLYDCYGSPCTLEETGGTEVAMVRTSTGRWPAIRLAASTYIAVDGRVYSASQARSKEYSTPENFAWAKRELNYLGYTNLIQSLWR